MDLRENRKLASKEIQLVHPKGDQSWVFIERIDLEAETPIPWPPDAKSWLIWKDPDAGKDWGQEKKGTTEDEVVGWHHRFNGHGFGCTSGVGDGQGSLACCSSWGHKELDITKRLNWTELITILNIFGVVPMEYPWVQWWHKDCSTFVWLFPQYTFVCPCPVFLLCKERQVCGMLSHHKSPEYKQKWQLAVCVC